MQASSIELDSMFRRFQIQKFNRKRIVPTVSMMINVDASRMLELINELNIPGSNTSHLTVTHMVIKVVANTLLKYPILYSFFNGSRIINNPELVMNIPVDIENHVEYIKIHKANAKSLHEIATECKYELGNILKKEGEFYKYIQHLDSVPSWIQKLYTKIPGSTIKFLREHYGNFVISNFGSFNINNGSLALAQPLIASLCICKISPMLIPFNDHDSKSILNLPLSIVFDHRAVDGAYVGRFLNDVKDFLETPEKLMSIK